MNSLHPLMVRKIKHLTDARYFAAMGTDWMSIELTGDPASFIFWHTLRDWVEGVRLIAEIDMKNDMLLAKTIIEAKPDGLLLKKGDAFDHPGETAIFNEVNLPGEIIMEGESKSVLLYNEMMWTESMLKLNPEKLFLQANWTKRILAELISTGYAGGICFLGGDEDKTGVRDYGEMDEMMEILGR